MILALLAGSAVRSILLGLAVGALLKVLKVRRPSTRMTVWTIVLVVSVATPALTPWMKIAVPIPEPQASIVWQTDVRPSSRTELIGVRPEPVAPSQAAPSKTASSGDSWEIWATVLYVVGASAMLIRLVIGLVLSLGLARTASAIDDHWTESLKVRVSAVLKSPATFGSTIFLPADYGTWGEDKRRAVLLHEGSHVANRDFHVLLLSSLYRIAFWFSPFAWWLSAHLSKLAEMVADDAAASGLGDRLRYAEILSDLARRSGHLPAGLAMARQGTLEWRIQRQYTIGSTSDVVPRWSRLALAFVLLPLAVLSAVTVTSTKQSPPGSTIGSAERDLTILAVKARRLVLAPGRFLRQTPFQGGEAALRTELSSLCCDTPPYSRVGVQLLDRLEKFKPGLRGVMARLGAPRALTFKGVGPGGYDIYDVHFERGLGEIRLYMTSDGTLEDLNLNPTGNDLAGGLVDCAQESSLTPPHAHVPTRLAIVNHSGMAVDIAEIRQAGRRQYRASLPNGAKANLGTSVEQPLLVSDAGGRCLGIILAGQTTRTNFIGSGGVLMPNAPRQTALAGGAEFLEQYFDGVRRGAPSYVRMTAEAITELQRVEHNRRVILEGLGPLEEIQFEGVSGLGEDIYKSRFTNGLCEWRITFDDEGRVAHLDLGPVFQG